MNNIFKFLAAITLLAAGFAVGSGNVFARTGNVQQTASVRGVQSVLP